ncbi:MAG: transcription termination factor NusA [candidate division WOR-3 bacterium]
MVFKEILSAMDQIAAEKDLPKEKVLQTVEMAFAAAYKKEFGKKGQKIVVMIDPKKSSIKIYQEKIVVDETLLKEESQNDQAAKQKADKTLELQEKELSEINPKDIIHFKISEAELEKMKELPFRFKPQRHIMFKQAKKLVKGVALGDKLLFPLPFKEEFGRIAAQTAKQVIIQKIREAERDSIYEEFKKREGQIISGFIQKIQGPIIYVDLGKTVGIFPQEEQIFSERYREQERMSFYVSSVELGQKGAVVFLSRSSSEMIKKMLELEVPEIANKIVQIKSIAREAGSRSKVAVYSSNEEIDPIGACVGQRGTRIAAIINEFNGEKIDIIKWSADEKEFIASALSPAKILNIDLDENTKSAIAWVAPDQQSLAIGKKGQNVRLAAKLTGWKIDVRVKGDKPETAEIMKSEKTSEPKEVAENMNEEIIKKGKNIATIDNLNQTENDKN